MEYREIGKTGKQGSIIGLGCENLDGRPYEQAESTIKIALDAGVNIFDVFMPGQEVRENVARAIGNRRDEVYIQGHIGSTDINKQYDISRDLPTVKRYFEDCLRIFGGYIDFGMLFFIDSEEDFNKTFHGGLADYAQKLKQNGDIGHIGFSSHRPETAIKAIETGLPEMLMFSINLAFDMTSANQYSLEALEQGFEGANFRGLDPERAALYTLCEKRGVGISVMKSLGAGKLISPEHTPFSKPMSVNQCIEYALDRPAVFSALLGCSNADEMRNTLEYIQADATSRDYTEFLREQPNDFIGKCVYCGHCQPCPEEIDVATVTKYLDIAKLDESAIPPSIVSHYHHLEANAEDCTECGNCEQRCPFDVSVIHNMKEAARLFA